MGTQPAVRRVPGGTLRAKLEEQRDWLDERLFAWLDNRDSDDEVQPWDLDDPANLLHEPEKSFALWNLCQATEWAHLPKAGGWLDQDDIWLHDAMVIARRVSILRSQKKGTEKAHEKAAKQMGIKGVALDKLMRRG